MKTLIINLGPPGDVLRTTVLLQELQGDVYWLSKKACADVLKSKKIKKLYFIEDKRDVEDVKNEHFNLVISLNEELDALNILKNLKKDKVVGVYLDSNGKIDYTEESAYWFNMSLVSKFGKNKADELKKINKKPFQQIMLEICGKEWSGQEYDLGILPKKIKGVVGMINVATGKWPNKNWAGYDELAEKLKREGVKVKFLGIRDTIAEHIEDINSCELVVCGDTLGMHAALALKKKVIALFNCTSPDEIYGYNRMVKIISPLLAKYFYIKEYNEESIKAISVEEVYSAVKKTLKA